VDQRNVFQLQDYLNDNRDEAASGGISIGAFTLQPGKNPGKVWMTGPSGQGAEVDVKVKKTC